MLNDLDRGWLAGIFDGEGCVTVLRHRRPTGTVHTVAVTIGGTSKAMFDHVTNCVEELGITSHIYEAKQSSANKPYYLFRIAAKHDVLTFFEGIEDTTREKQPQIRVAIWYLRRSCAVTYYKPTKEDVDALESLFEMKRSDDVPDAVSALLGQWDSDIVQ